MASNSPPKAHGSTSHRHAKSLSQNTKGSRGPYASLAPDDPRSSSTQSLLPEHSTASDQRRTLLLIYIHGFMGTETSFKSFPLHVHNYLSLSLADSHVVHSKIYPRYKSKKQIQFSRDDFSRWLAPHESQDTDVVLLGHSMGGLVAAEVVLSPSTAQSSDCALRHRILGTVNLDVPFLGMHPGVVGAGLASIFRSKSPDRNSVPPEPSSGVSSPSTTTLMSNDGAPSINSVATLSSEPSSQTQATVTASEPTDPNFNPSFKNDVKLPVRKTWESALHFINKHSDSLIKSSSAMVKSHLEFGGAMADYPGLKSRYNRLRGLEADDEEDRASALKEPDRHVPRVRFVNYYTASSGRPKKDRSRSASETHEARGRLAQIQSHSLATLDTAARSRSQSPRISVEERTNSGNILQKQAEIPETPVAAEGDGLESDSSLDPDDLASTDGSYEELKLPDIPPEPEPPALEDVSSYTDPNVRKLMERHNRRLTKAYARAKKDRLTAIKDREKLEEKYKRSGNEVIVKEKSENDDAVGAATDLEAPRTSRTSEEQHDQATAEDEADILARYRSSEEAALTAHRQLLGASRPQSTIEAQPLEERQIEDLSLSRSGTAEGAAQRGRASDRKTKDRKFCVLPGKNARGERDPTWVRIYMQGVDEVGAHCGLFEPSDTYEMLVGEVGQRIEDWIREDMTRRVIEGHA